MARTTEDWEVCQPDRRTPPPVRGVRATRSELVMEGGEGVGVEKKRGGREARQQKGPSRLPASFFLT